MITQDTDQNIDESWKHEKSCWVAFRGRGYNGSTVYWGPFDTYHELEQWAQTLDFGISAVELKSPHSDPTTWWYP